MESTLYDKCKAVYSDAQLALLEKAIAFAKRVHEGQLRESGEPYYIHPEAVATMLFDMGMDVPTVIAGLLHDVVEDGKDVTIAQIAELFGKEIAAMVDGVTKLTKSSKEAIITKKERQAENLRKMFLAIASDVRIVIIKLADRLHNMRTLEYCTSAKRTRKAKETLEIYAPLAHRFGMGAIKCELEDLSFMHLMPDEYEKMVAEVGAQQQERMEQLKSAMETIQEQLKKAGIEGEINGRPKHLYSIYRKMVKQNRPLEEIFDLIAVRVIVNTINDCYAVLGIIHSIWKPMPGRFKDYIAMPKPNMYRSLHTTLFGDKGLPFEVQIRTFEMHRTAEYGIAAHWMYKEGRQSMTELDRKTSWLRQVLEAEENSEDSKEFVDNILKDFLGEYVFVLTPRGEIIDLPVGSTPLDFAYRIHTNVGHHCQHARVNGNVVRLDYKLKTNDVVEIITSNSQAGPSRDWLSIVKTQSAKNKIRQWFKHENREENIQRGREMLEETAKRHAQSLAILMKPEYVNEVLKRHNLASVEDLYSAIGFGGVSAGQVLHKLIDLHRKEERLDELQKKLEDAGQEPAKKPQHKANPKGIIVHGDPGMAVFFGNCCNPLPGDPIVGYITRGRGVSVHRADCKNLESLMKESERMIEVEWALDARTNFSATIRVFIEDRPGSLLEVSKVLLGLNVNMTDLSSKSTDDGYAAMEITCTVESAEQLDVIISNLKKIKQVVDVFRA